MDKFEVLRLIGEGGYGVVYKCKSKDTGDIVAIKKIKHCINGDPRKVGLREIRILTVLKHPNINQLLGAFKSRDRLFLVLECVERTLLDVLNENPTGIASNRFRSYTYQLACALQYCHSKGIVHRDVKPENLLLTERDVLKLCDFGFARFLPSPQNAAAATGEEGDLPTLPTGFHQLTVYVATRWYRSPELILRLPYGKPADIWTIGCILAEMATGEPLFCGDTDIDQLFQITNAVGSFTADQMEAMLASPKYQFITTASSPSAGKLPVPSKDSLQRFQEILGEEMYDVLIGCINNDPNQRITAESCADHPGFELERRSITPVMATYEKLTQILNPKPVVSRRNSRWDWSKMILDLPDSPDHATPRSNNVLSKEEEMLMDAEVDLEKERESEEETAHQLVKQQQHREFGLRHLASLVSSDMSSGTAPFSYGAQQKSKSRPPLPPTPDSSSLPKIPQLQLQQSATLPSSPMSSRRSSRTWFQSSMTLPSAQSISSSNDDKGSGHSNMIFNRILSQVAFPGSQQKPNGSETGEVVTAPQPFFKKVAHSRFLASSRPTAAATGNNNNNNNNSNSIPSQSQLNVYVSSKSSSDVVKWETFMKQNTPSSNNFVLSTKQPARGDFSTTTLRNLKYLNNSNNVKQRAPNTYYSSMESPRSDFRLPDHYK